MSQPDSTRTPTSGPPDHDGRADHVTPAYVESPDPDTDHAAMGHALDPQTEPAADGSHAAMGHGSPAAADHAGMDHGAAGGHGGMAHDMSDPAMAAAMERDIRTRFWLALALTIPTILYSSIGRNTLGVDLPSPLPDDWTMLLLSTPVVFSVSYTHLTLPTICSV